MKTRLTPALRCLVDEIGNAVALGIDLDDEFDLEPAVLAKLDQPVEKASQFLLRARLSSVMKKPSMPCAEVLAHDRLEIVRRPEAALAALHIDDGAEGALIGAAAAQIEARAPTLAQAQF